MNKLKCSLAAKITAWILSFIVLSVSLLCILISNYMIKNNFYDRTEKEVQMRVARSTAYNISYRLFSYYEDYRQTNSPYLLSFDELASSIEGAKNFRYTFSDQNGNVIAGNFNGENSTRYDFENQIYLENFEVWTEDEEPPYETYKVSIYVLNEKTETDRFLVGEKIVSILYGLRFSVYFILAFCMMLFITLTAFLISSAGHRKPDGEIQKGLCEKTPCDVFTIYIILAFFVNLLVCITCYEVSEIMVFTAAPILLLLDYVLVSLWVKNIAINVKLGTTFSNLATVRLLKPIIDSIKKSRGLVRTAFLSSIPCILLLLIIYLFMGGYMIYDVFLLWCLCTAVYIGLALYRTIKLQKLLDATFKMAAGDLSESIDTKKLYGEMRALGENINQINSGLQIAVSDKMKSERFKTELITNVSHDLKTPLTSIINYIDLLEKLNLEDDEAKGYIEVLSRQSMRLKKLTEDLVEASKASTGNIEIELSRCDVGILISQTVGEFSERLEAAGLSVIMNVPDEPVFIMADGKRLYRVFENLMSNICKYSLEGTRVYIEAKTNDKMVKISFKNISKEMLSVSSEELTKRFVRGDSSRNTEGSGLGLSIAKSLTELQGGEFELKVDGDLFVADVFFEICK